MDVLTRSYDAARTGMNTQETNLTPQKVGNNLLIRQVSLHINDDPRIEAQPLYVSGVDIGGKRHDVVYVSTMANNIWAFDASNGKPVWQQPVHLGRPIRPNGTEIDLFGINILWGILSTPAIDRATGTIYAVCWTSLDGTVARAGARSRAADGRFRPPNPHRQAGSPPAYSSAVAIPLSPDHRHPARSAASKRQSPVPGQSGSTAVRCSPAILPTPA